MKEKKDYSIIMKYILIKNQEEKEDDVLNDIAEFLWDSGHEVDLADWTEACFENKLHTHYDCYISIIKNYDACQSVLDRHRSVFKNFNSFRKAGHILIFSDTGVYTDAIPYPHKIFDYNHLDRESLQRFFRWCRKISLFIKA
ncbi:hypothetical protein ASE55_15965 [Chryseobacterium sp. Leaf201]|nr:hypothetical protein ASE55_15965 [Chryseobacterium sp. Leaf201]